MDLFVVVRFHNGLNLIDHSIQLVICGVEMGRNPNTGVRPVIDQHFAARKLTFDFFAVRYVDNHHAATSSRVAARAHGKTRFVCQLNQALSLT